MKYQRALIVSILFVLIVSLGLISYFLYLDQSTTDKNSSQRPIVYEHQRGEFTGKFSSPTSNQSLISLINDNNQEFECGTSDQTQYRLSEYKLPADPFIGSPEIVTDNLAISFEELKHDDSLRVEYYGDSMKNNSCIVIYVVRMQSSV